MDTSGNYGGLLRFGLLSKYIICWGVWQTPYRKNDIFQVHEQEQVITCETFQMSWNHD